MTEPAQNPLFDRMTWMRLLYMILFGLVLQIVGLGVALVAVVQLSAKLATGETYSQLRKLGDSLAGYGRHIMAYLTFSTEELPYPFAPVKTDELRPGADPGGGQAFGAGVTRP